MDTQAKPHIEELQQLRITLSDDADRIEKIEKEYNELQEGDALVDPGDADWEWWPELASFAGVVVVLLLVFHVIMWVPKKLFDITWDTWGWFIDSLWIGGGILVGSAIIYWIYYAIKKGLYEANVERAQQLENEYEDLTNTFENNYAQINRLFADDVRGVLGIPMTETPKQVMFEEIDHFENLIEKYHRALDYYNTSTYPARKADAKRQLFRTRLYLFYQLSVKGESEHTYDLFQSRLEDSRKKASDQLLRQDFQTNKLTAISNNLPSYKHQLEDNRMDPILRRMGLAMERDTGHWLHGHSVDKLSAQTEELSNLYNAAKDEYKELADINEKVIYLLEFARVSAFRNIYLGTELVTYLRTNRGGLGLTTEHDLIDLSIDLQEMDFTSDDITFDSLDTLMTTLDNNSDMIEKMFLGKLGKGGFVAGAAMVGMEMLGDYLNGHNQAVENNIEIQRQLVEGIEQMVDTYSQGQRQLLRAIEIIKAITHANDGFMKIYETLRDRVFYGKPNSEPPTMAEFKALVEATKEYQKISKSKL